jgi:hypothetical protein
MIDAFKAKFGNKWNDDWTVAELGEYLDNYVDALGCSAIARHIDYGSIISSLCYDDMTVWKCVDDEKGHPSNFNCKFNEDDIAQPHRFYNNAGLARIGCKTDGLFVITDADMHYYDNDDATSEK